MVCGVGHQGQGCAVVGRLAPVSIGWRLDNLWALTQFYLLPDPVSSGGINSSICLTGLVTSLSLVPSEPLTGLGGVSLFCAASGHPFRLLRDGSVGAWRPQAWSPPFLRIPRPVTPWRSVVWQCLCRTQVPTGGARTSMESCGV